MLIYRVLFSQNRKNDRSNLNWTIDKHPSFNASLVHTHTHTSEHGCSKNFCSLTSFIIGIGF